MQPSVLSCLAASAALFVSFSIPVAQANQTGSTPSARAAVKSFPADRNLASPRAEVAQPLLVLPVEPQLFPQRRFPAAIGAEPREQVIIVPQFVSAPVRERVEPISVSVLDPTAVVSRSPSGSVVIGGYDYGPRYHRGQRRGTYGHLPYAPPSFQMIGAASGRHMEQPVRLTFGVEPRRRFNPGPKVVWLDGRGEPLADSAHVRRLK